MASFPTLINKIKGELRISPEPGFPTLGRTHYFALLQELHQKLEPKAYLEIGTESGASLSLAKCTSFAIDPAFGVEADVIGDKPGLFLQQCTSDEFFASGLLERLGVELDLAFLDGMHLYEYLLRDFINTEKHMSQDGVILLHDCVPFSSAGARREWDRKATASWTGDVWKLLPILRQYRSDLAIRTFDTPPSGLVEITNLDPENTTLSDNLEEIAKQFDDLSFEQLGLKEFERCAAITAFKRKGSHPATAIQPLSFRIQTPVPEARWQAGWGDHAFANSLADAFKRAGHTAEVKPVPEWHMEGAEDQVDLVLRGDAQYERRYGHMTLYWVLYFDDVDALRHDLIQADHVFASGQPLADDLSAIFGNEVVSVLPQAFDASLMRPPEEDAVRSGVTFVGLAKRFRRPIVRQAFRAKLPLQLWGRGWENSPAAEFARGKRLSQEELGRVYGQSEIVLNDHRREMSQYGLVSNRIFDALACAAPVISDPVAWLPPDLEPFVHQAVDFRAVKRAAVEIAAEDKARRAERRELALRMREEHSFDARARDIVRMVRSRSHLSDIRKSA